MNDTAVDLITELRRAAAESNPLGAVRAATSLIEGGHSDDALDALAAHAADSAAMLNALVETLDASRVVHRFAGSMLLDRAAIDDVVQDSLISVVESISGYQGGSKFTTWVHTIVKRRVVDYLRRQRETTPITEDLAPAARMSSMIANRATVRQTLDRLPEKYRAPVVLRDIEGQPYSEIAKHLGLSIGTVKSQVSRGRAMVAGMIAPTTDRSEASR